MKEPKGSWESFWSGAGIVVTVFAVIGGLLLLTKYIDYEIDIKVNDSAYIKKVSSTIRPSVIFDQKGSILADMGAMDYIDDIKINKRGELLLEIKVSPRKFLAMPPVLECLDGSYAVDTKRGNKFDWIYELKGVQHPVTDKSAIISNERFRLEVLR